MLTAPSSALCAFLDQTFRLATTSPPPIKSRSFASIHATESELTMARWGLIPFWMKVKPKVPHINARAETVHKLPLFREAFAKRRCLIPATGNVNSVKNDTEECIEPIEDA